MQFALWPKDLLCVLCESLAFFAVKFFFTAKLVRSAGEPRGAGALARQHYSLMCWQRRIRYW